MNCDLFGRDISRLKKKKLCLFDMDGTIYRDNALFDGVKEYLAFIARSGGKYVFVTNNSSRSVGDYVKKLLDMGVIADEENFLTSTQAAVLLFKDKFENKKIYAQGTASFIEELKTSGLNVTCDFDLNAFAILVGFDTEITGEKLRTTCKMLTVKKDIPFYATNPDWVCPVDFGYIPDCGSMCFAIGKATGRTPAFIGKPEPAMIDIAREKFGADKKDVVVFGDRLYTDIASGKNAGVDSVLVLSGEATLKDLNESDVKPDFVLNSVYDVIADGGNEN